MEIIIGVMIMIFVLGLISLLFYWKIRPRLAMRKLVAKEAFFFHQDLYKKIELLEDDQSMTNEDWEKMLEIAQFADERFLKKCPGLVPEFQSLAEIVAEIIEERQESK